MDIGAGVHQCTELGARFLHQFELQGILGVKEGKGGLVYYESRKRKLKTRLIYEYRCDERLKN